MHQCRRCRQPPCAAFLLPTQQSQILKPLQHRGKLPTAPARRSGKRRADSRPHVPPLPAPHIIDKDHRAGRSRVQAASTPQGSPTLRPVRSTGNRLRTTTPPTDPSHLSGIPSSSRRTVSGTFNTQLSSRLPASPRACHSVYHSQLGSCGTSGPRDDMGTAGRTAQKLRFSLFAAHST
jgi:hypothetical protein